jgi:polyhydroxyalkanoate synthesis regulator phasin
MSKKSKISATIGFASSSRSPASAVNKAIDQMVREGVPLDSNEARDRVHAAARKERRSAKPGRAKAQGRVLGIESDEAMEWLATGQRMRRRANKGGREPNVERDKKMAVEFLQKKESIRKNGSYSVRSDTALKEMIGIKYGVKKRSAAMKAINRGLKLLGT